MEQRQLKERLARELEIKDLGRLKYFLGIEVAYSEKGIFLSQRKYVLELLEEIGILGGKATSTLVEPNLKMVTIPTTNQDKDRYQRLFGFLMYLSHTRPDISFVLCL